MGYTTDFKGNFEFSEKPSDKTLELLSGLNKTRRMARSIEGYGIEGEFYYNKNTNDFGQEEDKNIINYNKPPKTQPGLWNNWKPSECGMFLEWDGGEKFYKYVEWIKYLIKNIIEPDNLKLNGTVQWRGEECEDYGTITIKDNQVSITC